MKHTLKSRLDFPKLLPSNAIGIELGVALGYYSDVLLNSTKVTKLYSIDRWTDHHGIDEYLSAAKKLAVHGSRSVVIRSSFDDIIHLFPDEYFDFIYIDAYAHTGQENGRILSDWYEKLKTGGIFAGHDYEPEKWSATYHAVNEFCERNALILEVIPGFMTKKSGDDLWASWYTSKN
jgi:SAM-dependent methyltransferase